MVPRFKVETSKVLLFATAFSVCALAAVPVTVAQRLPKATGRERENKPVTSRRENRPKRPTATAGANSSASVESDNFLNLGHRFREQKKWKAAEAAYKEAVTVWPGNVDALLELGFLYLDGNRIDEAQKTYTDLRARNASYASTLLAEITRHKARLDH